MEGYGSVYAIEQTRAQGHSDYGDGCVPVLETSARLKMEVMYCIGTSAPTVRRAGEAYPDVCTQAYALTDARQPSNIICSTVPLKLEYSGS